MSLRQALMVTTGDARSGNAHIVRTLLDMVTWLEHAGESVVTVFLGGEFARDREVATFVRETYPSVELVVGDRGIASASVYA